MAGEIYSGNVIDARNRFMKQPTPRITVGQKAAIGGAAVVGTGAAVIAARNHVYIKRANKAGYITYRQRDKMNRARHKAARQTLRDSHGRYAGSR